MASRYDNIPDDVKAQAAAENSSAKRANNARGSPDADRIPKGTSGKAQRRIFKKKRAGVILTRDEVKAVKAGRKKLRKELRKQGLRSKQDFEMTAASLGLYFDKRQKLFPWLWKHWLGMLIAGALALLAVLFLFSIVQEMRGHYTINMSEEMFKEGFVLSDNADFTNPTTKLFALPSEDLPCISICQIPPEIDMIDGNHSENYFAYTYYIRNEGENEVGYVWDLTINHESNNLSEATWVIIFEDGEMRFFAKPNKTTGEAEALPAIGDNSKGYISLPIKELAPDSDQFEVVESVGRFTYYRVIPESFQSDILIANGSQNKVLPMDVHKYTVVLFMDGDDPDCTDELIGGTLGVEMNFRMTGEDMEGDENLGLKWNRFWERVWQGMDFLNT